MKEEVENEEKEEEELLQVRLQVAGTQTLNRRKLDQSRLQMGGFGFNCSAFFFFNCSSVHLGTPYRRYSRTEVLQ